MNAKDHQALAALFTEDAEFVSINGARLHRRDAIATGHARVFSQALADSEVSVTQVDTKFLNEDIVLCHAGWSRASAADAIPATGTFTLMLPAMVTGISSQRPMSRMLGNRRKSAPQGTTF